MTNPYLDLVGTTDDPHAQADAALRSSFYVAQKSPGAAENARTVGAADATGLPLGTVQRNPAVVQDDTTLPDPVRLQQRSPGLAAWYAVPQNAMIAKGQHEAVQQIHDAAQRISIPFQPMSAMQADMADMRPIVPDVTKGPEPLRAAALGLNDLLTGAVGTYMAVGGPIDGPAAAQFFAERQQHAAKLAAAAPAYVVAYDQAKQAQARRATIEQALDLYHTGAGTVADALDMIATAVTHPRGAASSMIRGTVASAPALAGGGLLGAAGVGGGFAFTSVGQDLLAQLQQRGVDVTDHAQLARAFRDPALMASVRRKSLASGLTSSAVMALTSALGSRYLVPQGAGASALTTLAADAGVQSGSMAAGALAGQAASGEPLDPHAAMANAVAMLGFSVAHAGLGLAGGAAGAGGDAHASEPATPTGDPIARASALHAETVDALTAIQQAQHLSDLHQGIADAPHVAALPARLQQLVAMVAPEGASPTVHFDTDEWDSYFQSRHESPAQVAADVLGDDGHAYTEAKATGGTLAVPLADYAARLAPRPESEGLVAIARMRPDGPSLADAQATLDALPKNMADVARQARTDAKAAAPTSDVATWADVFEARTRAQLTAAGRSASEAKIGAQLLARVYQRTAASQGTTPDVIAAQYPVSIEGAKALDVSPVSGKVRDTDGTLRFAEARTATGAIRDPRGVATDALFEEYARIIAASAVDNEIVGQGQYARTDEYGFTNTGSSRTSMRASGRIAARGKALARMDAEFARRGFDAAAISEQATAASERNAERDAIQSEPDLPGDAMLDDPTVLFQARRPAYEGRFGLIPFVRGMPSHADAVKTVHVAFDGAFRTWDRMRDAGPKPMAGDDMLRAFNDAAEQAAHAMNRIVHDGGMYRRARQYGIKGIAPDVVRYLAMQDADALASYYVTGEKAGAKGLARAMWDIDNDRAIISELQQGDARETSLSVFAEADREIRKSLLGEDAEGNPLPGDDELARQENVQRSLGESYFQTAPHDVQLPDADGTMRYVDARTAEGVLRPLGDVTTDGLATELVRTADSPHGDAIRAEMASRGLSASEISDRLAWATERDRTEFLLQSHGDTPRGKASFSTADATGAGFHTVIRLFQGGADRSTFFHEAGHFYVQMLTDLAARPDAPEQVRTDLATLRAHAGAEGDEKLTRAQHETIARSFEAYLMEGKAPSTALRGAFRRLKGWLLGIYGSVQSLGVSLSPEVRAVFDRALASEHEIQSAERANHVAPLFHDFHDPVLEALTPEERARYDGLMANVHDAATEALTTKMMARLLREGSADWKRQREAGRADVIAQVNADPTQRAVALLAKGTAPDGTPLEAGVRAFKLDAEATKDYVQGRTLPPGVTTAEGGVDPDVAASMLGFDSGLDLVDALVEAPRRKALIERMLDERARQQHGEPPDDPETYRAAATALVRDRQRSEAIREELRLLAAHTAKDATTPAAKLGRPIPSVEAIRGEAERQVGTKAVGALRPDVLRAAASKAAKAAADAYAKGDFEATFAAKQRELLATELFRAATNAKAEVAASLKSFAPIFRSDERLAKSRDMAYVAGARSLLAHFGLARSDESPWAFLETIQNIDPDTADGVQAIVQDALAATGAGMDYRRLTVDQFRTMHTAVDALWQQALRTKQIVVDGVKRERTEVVAELRQRLADRLPDEALGTRKAPTELELKWRGVQATSTVLARTEHWIRMMDGGATDGPFRRFLWNGPKDGETAFMAERLQARARFREIVEAARDGDAFTGDANPGRIPAPELSSKGYTFKNKAELLGALLHAGNKGNRERLLRGGRDPKDPWGDFDEHGTLDTSKWDAFIHRMQQTGVLTKADYDFAQAVWNHFETYRARSQRTHYAAYGYPFEEVTPEPIVTPWGEYPGGYYPAKADPVLAPDAVRLEEADRVLQGDNAFATASVGRGFAKSRVAGTARPLILDAGAVPYHIDAQLRFIHLAEPVMDVARLVRDRTFADQVNRTDPHAITEILDPWLRRVAKQQTETIAPSKAGRAFNNIARAVRRNAAIQLLAFSKTVALEQTTHIFAAKMRVPVWRMAEAQARFAAAPREFSAMVHAQSPYMVTRNTAGYMEAKAAVERVLMAPNADNPLATALFHGKQAAQWAQDHGTFLAKLVQHDMDMVLWHAAHADAVATHGYDAPLAVRHADATVREVMASYEPSAQSRFESGEAWQKMLAMFASVFINRANLVHTDITTAVRSDLGTGPKVAKVAMLVAIGLMAPAIVGTTLKRAASKQPVVDTDQNGLDWHDWLRLGYESNVEGAERMVPIFGPIVGGAITAQHGHPVDAVTSPAVELLQHALQHKDATDVFTLLGILTGAPLRPVGQVITTVRAH